MPNLQTDTTPPDNPANSAASAAVQDGNQPVIQPTPAPAATVQPNAAAQAPVAQVAAPSNRPDADTAAAKSIPARLVNNPAVPTQKMAAQADSNKNSDSPPHDMLFRAGVAMTGGPQYTSKVSDGTLVADGRMLDTSGATIPEGTAIPSGQLVHTQVRPSLAHLGLAMALQILSGGMAGAAAPPNKSGNNAGAAFQAGSQVADQARAKVSAANQQQDAQAVADSNRKMAMFEANMRNYQTFQNVSKSSQDIAQGATESTKDFTDDLLAGKIELKGGATFDPKTDVVNGDDVQMKLKNGQSNITKDWFIPVGDAFPTLGQDGKQVVVNGVPQWSHQWATIHGAANGTMPLTKDMQDKFVTYGLMKPIPAGGIGEPDWPLSNIAKNYSMISSIDAGEQLLLSHKNDVTDLLGHDGHGGPDGKGKAAEDLESLTSQMAGNTAFKKGLSLFAQAQAGSKTGNLEDVLDAMRQRDATAANAIAQHLGLSPDDLEDMKNKRTTARAAAGAEGKAEAVTPDTMGKALAVANNPASTPDQTKWANGVIAGFNQQEKTKADNAADAAQAKEDYKQQLKDQRTMGYVEDQKGDVYHVSQWQAEHMPNYSAQTFIEKKPSDISADQKAIKPINDIQNNINGYREANNRYAAASAVKGSPINIAEDRSNLSLIFSAPAITDAAEAHGGAGGIGITIPTLSADLNKSLANKVLAAYNALSPEGKTMADSYARMRGAIPAYVKVITNTGRGSKEQLDIELQNIMPPYFNQSDIGHRIETFQGNLDTQKAGFPKNLAGSHFVATSGGPSAPSAQTHNFSIGAWQKANPTGDANAAKAAAQKQGLTVIQ